MKMILAAMVILFAAPFRLPAQSGYAENDTLGNLALSNATGRIFLTQSVYDSAPVCFLRSLEICEAAGKS